MQRPWRSAAYSTEDHQPRGDTIPSELGTLLYQQLIKNDIQACMDINFRE
jgi:hypothetical protein